MIFVCFNGFAVCPEALAAAAVAIDERDIDGDASGVVGSAADGGEGTSAEAIVVCPSRTLSSRADSCVPAVASGWYCVATSAFTVRDIELQFCH